MLPINSSIRFKFNQYNYDNNVSRYNNNEISKCSVKYIGKKFLEVFEYFGELLYMYIT